MKQYSDTSIIASLARQYCSLQNGVPNIKKNFKGILRSNHHNMPPSLSHSSIRQTVWFQLESGKDDGFIFERTKILVRPIRKIRLN